jgi:hypothetical protein
MAESRKDLVSLSTGDSSSIATDPSFMILHEVEQRLQEYRPEDAEDDTILVLRAFLDYLPTDGKSNLLDDIRACETDDELRQHALSLVEGLLYPMRTHPQTPSIATSPRFGIEDSIENLASSTLVEPATRGPQAWLKQACLARDGNKCTITGAIHRTRSARARSVRARLADASQARAPETYTECVHIVPFSLASWGSSEEQRRTSQIWVNLYRCFPSLCSRINFTHESVNDTRNAITMDRNLHFYFSQFDLTLEPTDQIHTYRTRSYQPNMIYTRNLPASGFVTFTNHNTRHELPSPTLLELHAAITKILHATGKADQADMIREDKDNIGVLATDGSTNVAALLSVTSLSPLAPRPISSCGTRPLH